MQRRVHASWSEPYLSARLTGSAANVRLGDGAKWLEGATDLRMSGDALFVAFDGAIAIAPRVRAWGDECGEALVHEPFPGGEIACLAALELPTGRRLLALSSGKTADGRRFALLDPARPQAPIVSSGRLDSFFEHMAVRWDIVGTQLNLEAALGLPDAVRFVQRGDGPERAGRRGHNTVFDIGLSDWMDYVESALRDRTAPFRHEIVSNIFGYDLGSVANERLSFSGAGELGEGWSVYAASAVRADGSAAGAVLGLLGADGRAMQAPLRGPDDEPVAVEIRGLAVSGQDGQAIQVLIAVDPEALGTVSPFLTGELRGTLVPKLLEEVTGTTPEPPKKRRRHYP